MTKQTKKFSKDEMQMMNSFQRLYDILEQNSMQYWGGTIIYFLLQLVCFLLFLGFLIIALYIPTTITDTEVYGKFKITTKIEHDDVTLVLYLLKGVLCFIGFVFLSITILIWRLRRKRSVIKTANEILEELIEE